jgi:predicted nucleic acid-binding protein
VSERYFADTAFWIALSSARDTYRDRAVLWATHVASSGIGIVTTEAVLWEWLNGMAHPKLRLTAAAGYRRCYLDPMIEVVELDSQLRTAGLEMYESRSDKAWSLTDCVSFVVMQQSQLVAALSTDHHFVQAGYRALLLDEPNAG